jgi:hypothetical protein
MKNALLTLLLLAVVQCSYTQVFYNAESNNLRYAGGMKPEVFEKLNDDEKTILNECIIECGVKPEEVIWVTKEVYDKLENPDYYSTKVVFKSTSNRKGNTNNYEGQNKLVKPQFMVFLDRYNGEFEIILQMYY